MSPINIAMNLSTSILVGMLIQGCKSKNASSVKDVHYLDEHVADRFTLAETCKGEWQSVPDSQCQISLVNAQGTSKSARSEDVYRTIGLADVPAGKLGEQEAAKRQSLVNAIGDAQARQKGQAALDKFKENIAQKNILKRNLAKSSSGATCFGGSTVGDSKIKCTDLESAMGSTGDDGSNWEVGAKTTLNLDRLLCGMDPRRGLENVLYNVFYYAYGHYDGSKKRYSCIVLLIKKIPLVVHSKKGCAFKSL